MAAATAGLTAGLVCATSAVAQSSPPLLVTVKVDPTLQTPGPTPTGRVTLLFNGEPLLSVALTQGIAPIIASPAVAASLRLLSSQVSLSYSGDPNYDPAAGVWLTLPTDGIVSLAVVPRDRAAPAIAIVAPADGARYARGQPVVARYACTDPQGRNPVTLCRGPVDDGAPLDTSVVGSFGFEVRTSDALGNAATRQVTYSVADPAPAGGAAAPPTDQGPAPGAPSVDEAPEPGAAPPSAPEPGGEPAAAAAPDEPPPAPSLDAEPAPSAAPGDAPAAGSAPPQAADGSDRPRPAAYDPRSNPAQAVATMGAAFTLLQLGGGGGIALAGARRRRHGVPRRRSGASGDSSAPQSDFSYEGIDYERLGGQFAALAAGDRSRTWGWPGTRAVDAVGVALPTRVARGSPLAARALEDAAYLRAILGSVSLLPPIVGIALGVAAVHDTGGAALPPIAALTIAIAVVGVLDAAAGLGAVATFALGVLLLGGIDSYAAVRTLVALSAIWFAVPILAGAARPLRRLPTSGAGPTFDRGGDFVIGSLIGAWVVYEVVGALPGLAGLELAIADHATDAAAAVLLALFARMGLETLAAHLYPKRLAIAEPAELPEPGRLQRLNAIALRGALFVLFATIIVGPRWQLWVGTALFIAPQVLGLVEDRLPRWSALGRVLPRGLLELVLVLLVVTALGSLVLQSSDSSASALANAFVILAIPGFALSMLGVFGGEPAERTLSWPVRLGGIAVLALGILLVLGELF